jgi:hypothetical protein
MSEGELLAEKRRLADYAREHQAEKLGKTSWNPQTRRYGEDGRKRKRR